MQLTIEIDDELYAGIEAAALAFSEVKIYWLTV